MCVYLHKFLCRLHHTCTISEIGIDDIDVYFILTINNNIL